MEEAESGSKNNGFSYIQNLESIMLNWKSRPRFHLIPENFHGYDGAFPVITFFNDRVFFAITDTKTKPCPSLLLCLGYALPLFCHWNNQGDLTGLKEPERPQTTSLCRRFQVLVSVSTIRSRVLQRLVLSKRGKRMLLHGFNDFKTEVFLYVLWFNIFSKI